MGSLKFIGIKEKGRIDKHDSNPEEVIQSIKEQKLESAYIQVKLESLKDIRELIKVLTELKQTFKQETQD